ncbi:MAG: adenylosuccinate synthetase [Candidatus Latescibacteria bacterium]|nr:adenylosuccinate synthetase [Candidatus Latescibacterota bacterium]
MPATIVVDALWGDSGKGKIAAYIAQKHHAAFAVRAGTGTNAGHSIHFENGESIRTHQLPCGWLDPKTQLRIGSGVAVDPTCFFDEIESYGLADRAKMDFRCAIIEPEHKTREKEDSHLTNKVGSTCSGTGAARADFILRRARQAQSHPDLKDFLSDVPRELNTACINGETVIIEGSQGTQLSLALTKDYPCCTSDNCTAIASADDVGLNWQHIAEVIMVLKAMPTRVGEGPLPNELSTGEIEKRGIAEYGVTTGRLRRKAAHIPWELLEEAIMLNGPTQIALTFCDHFDPEVTDIRNASLLTDPIRNLIREIEKRTQIPVTLVETGKHFEDIIDLST